MTVPTGSSETVRLETGAAETPRTMLLSSVPEYRSASVELLERYLHLPDAWPHGVPAELPDVLSNQLADFPGPARPPTGEVVLAHLAGQVVGQVLVLPHDDDTARLERMYVIDSFQRNGIGTHLLHHALDLARSLGYRRIVLDVIAERPHAVHLYETIGFRPIEPYADHGRPMSFLGRPL